MTRYLRLFSAAFAALCLFGGIASRVSAADPGTPGPYPVTSQDYLLHTAGDPTGTGDSLVIYAPPDLKSTTYPNAANELDGRVYYPKGIDDGASALPAGKMPLIILVHGRHGTSYNPTSGSSTTGWPPPTGSVQIPSYQGYDYEGNLLASWGYVVVSIGVNGINFFDNSSKDRGMLARAELIQKNLDMWKIISTTGGAPAPGLSTDNPFGTKFAGKVDMSTIGTMGHSRGGEGVMAHYVYNADPVNNPEAANGPAYPVKAVFAIAPVDYNRYNATNVPFAVILPYCDGDVSDNQGTHFFDDARYAASGDSAPKFFFTVMGANHNFYNTVWTPGVYPYLGAPYGLGGTTDDWLGTPSATLDPFASPTQPGNHRLSSSQEQGTGGVYMTAFFRTYIGNTVVPTTTQFLPFLKGDAPPPPSATTNELFETYHAPSTPSARLDIARFPTSDPLTTDTLGGAITASGLSPFVVAGGGPYPFTVTASSTFANTGGALDLTNFALPGQPAARQPGNTPSLYHPDMGGLSQLEVGWSSLSASLTFAVPAASANFTPFSVLTFRTALSFTDYRNTTAYTDFDVVLTDSVGNTAFTPVSAWSKALVYPPGMIVRLPKVELNGVRIPLSAFSGVNLAGITSVKFAFDRQPAGGILLTDLAVSD